MLKMVCQAIGHRLRVVQEFSPITRRVKCVRCGGDWGMHDGVRALVDWGPDLEQLHRDHGCEILEPLPAWRSFPMEPLTFPELIRAGRWPGAFAMALSYCAGYIVEAAGFGLAAQFIATAAVAYASMHLLMRRGCERRRNSLQA